jgi:hypothetical protein
MLLAALALPAVPAAAQGKALGKPAGAGKPVTATVKPPKPPKPTDTAIHGKSADAKGGDHGKSADHAKGPKTTTPDSDTTVAASESKGRGQLPLGEKIALNNTLKARLDGLLVGSTLTYDQATTGWKNQGQLVAAMNAAKNNDIAFASLYTEIITNGKSREDAVLFLKPVTPPPTTTTTTTPTTP